MYVSIVVILLVLAPGLISAQDTVTDVEVVRVYDGDTFYVDIRGFPPIVGDDMPVRVRGIDCPEIRSSCDAERALARQARDFAEDLLLRAERVDLIDIERGKYFRIVADVLMDGDDLALLLIDAGLAVPYEQRHDVDWCR